MSPALNSRFFKSFGFLFATALGFIVLSWSIGHLLGYLPEPIGSRSHLFIEGAKNSLYITLYSGILGLAVGTVVGLASSSTHVFFKSLSFFYVWIVRGTPVLVQILFVYYAVPALFPSMQFNEFWAAVLALGLNVGAYNGEVIKAGIVAVPKGQTEAARSLGMSKFKTMRWIVLPQAIKIVIPPLVNNVVALLKDSSLASTIGLLELTLAGNRISSETFMPVPVLTTVAALYLVYTTAITIVTHHLKKIMRWN